ncbi:acyl-ACP--UDP-N-acetylglucosamine O-acyltransferase, partial [Xanthomonas hortorum]
MRDSTPLIHPTAVIDPSATLADDVRVGAFSLISADVEIGAGTEVGPHCSIHGPTRIGRNNRFIGHAAIGGEPQDKKYAGERTELVIGHGNVIREFVTINRGTGGGGGITVVGDDNWMLAYTHVAHDCHVGNHCVFSNNTTLAGHVTVGDYVIISGFAGAH